MSPVFLFFFLCFQNLLIFHIRIMICISQLSLNHKRGRRVDRFFFLNQWSGKCHFPFRSLNTTEYTNESSLCGLSYCLQ